MRKRFLPTLLFLLFIAIPTFAQLRVTLNVSPRPDPYLSNWAQRKETAIVTIVNSGTTAVRAKFDCKINKDGSLIVNTKPDKMKILEIPTGVSQYYGEDLVPLEAAKIKEGADKTAIQTGMLPAGSYEFCCTLLDLQDRQITPPVCKNFTIQSYQAPVLLQPEDKSVVGKGNRPMFRWTAVSPKPNFPVTYHLRVFEVLKGQTPIIAFRVNKPILERNDIPVTQLLWPADVELPNIRLQYIWTVRALDEKGNPIGEPDGYATPFVIDPCCHNPPKPRDCCPPDDITDNTNGGVNAKQDKEKDSTKTGTLNPGGPTGPIGPAVPTGNPTPHPKVVEIVLVSPTEEQPTKDERPIFRWRTTGEKPSDLTYTFVFGEVDANGNMTEQRVPRGGTTVVIWPFSEKVPFVKQGLDVEQLQYPIELPPIDQSKSYAWFVIGVDKKGEIVAKSPTGFLMPMNCTCIGMFPLTWPVQSICLGQSAFIQGSVGGISGCSGPYVPVCTTLTGSTTTIAFIPTANNTPRYQVTPTNAGVHTYRITLTRGSCSKSFVFTVNVYPSVGTITALKDEVCHGDDNQLFALNANPPGNWVPIIWSYSDNGGSTWINAPTWSGNVGTSVNTNLIFSSACGSGQPFGIRKYRAQINYGDFGLPAPPQGSPICSEEIKDIKVWCPTVATLTGVSPSHTIKPGNKICSDNNGDGLPNYPITLNLSAGGFGTITGWSPTITGTSYSITGAGTYTFTVTRKNGECAPASASFTVIVADPPPIPILQIVKHNGIPVTAPCPFSVCPNDDATIQVSNFAAIQSASPGALYNWDYLPGVGTPAAACPEWNQGTTIAPSWIHAGGTGGNYEQNTNAMYPNVTSSQWDYVWWRVYVQDANAGCPSVSACCLIKITKKPCAPTISLGLNQNPKCPGSVINFVIGTPPPGPNCGPVTSQVWYRNGEIVTPPFTLPGNYQLMVKGPCDSAFSNVINVIERQISVLISGPCCAPNSPTMQLCVQTNGPIPNCPGAGIVQWRTVSPATSAWTTITMPPNPKCFNVPTPTTTTTYEVRYTRCGCTVTSQFTVTKCP